MCEFDSDWDSDSGGRCMGDGDEYLTWLFDAIDRYGWGIVGVLPGADRSVDPAFCYTVGLTALGYPELALYGLPHAVAGPWINAVADHVLRTGPLRDGAVVAAAGDRRGPQLVAVRMRRPGHLYVAQEIYPVEPVQAMQLAWSDPAGRYPWELGYDSRAFPQPLYGRAPTRLSRPLRVQLGRRSA